jgi:hypothetical protein
MYHNTSSVYSVNHPAKCIIPHYSSTDVHRFLVGTSSLHENNEITVLQYIEDSNHLESVIVCNHSEEVLAMEASPLHSELIITSHRNPSSNVKGMTLWRLPSLDDINTYTQSSDILELSVESSFYTSNKYSEIRSIKWNKKDEHSIVSIDNKVVTVWDIHDSTVKVIVNLLFFSSYTHLLIHCPLYLSTGSKCLASYNTRR